MESHHMAGNNSQSIQLAVGLDGSAMLSNLNSVVTDADGGGLNLIDIPLSIAGLGGFQSNIFSPPDDITSSANLVLNGISDVSLSKMSDNHFLHSVDALVKNEAKSPLNIMVVSDGLTSLGQSSPALQSQPNLPTSFQSMVSGGDKMLSAVNNLNFNDPEILGDAAFDSAPSGTLSQFDDGLLPSLGSTGHGLRLGDGTGDHSFDLFDGSVGDGLSLSPQPFSDTGLIPDTSASSLETGLVPTQSADQLLDSSLKVSQDKKSTMAWTAVSDALSQSKLNSSQCSVCGKTFNNITALAKHRLTHSDERKYVCNVCSKGFKRQDHLNGHLMTHLDKKPFECQLANCDKGYCDQRSLRRHLEQHHHLDPETIQTHVQASMAAAGISPPTPRNGSKSKSADKNGEAKSKQMSSPVYSPGSATPSPGVPGAGTGNVFHFEQLMKKQHKQHQHELLVQQIHQQQKLILQQQKQQKQQEEQAKGKSVAQTNDAAGKQAQLQKQKQQKQPTDVLAVIQQVEQLKQHFKTAQEQKKKAAEKDTNSQPDSFQWQDKAGVYTFVGTPTSSEQSPTARNDQSPSGIVVAGDMASRSPMSPVTVQPISPMTNQAGRAIWFNNSPDTAPTPKPVEEPPKTQAYCAECDRYFKNAAALNGHMRCHGGFNKKGKEKDKKSPVRKLSGSSSEMGPPLRRPPHNSTPSPQPAISRASPTTLNSGAISPMAPQSSIQSPVDQSSAIDGLNGPLSSEQLVQNKHKHLQEQLSSHLLKRRMSGDHPQQRPKKTHQQALIENPANQEQIRLLEEHIKVQQQQQHQHQHQSLQNIQVFANPLGGANEGTLALSLNPTMERAASPQQGEHIQRLVQSFQQVEELHRQEQQQQVQLSAEQLEQIHREHKLIGLPPLNPEQLQYQLQEQQNQMIQARLREQQLQEQQHQLQAVESGALVMTSSPLAQTELIQLGGNHQATLIPAQAQPQAQIQLTCQSTELADVNKPLMPTQNELCSSVQQILAALDPVVVSAAGINHQQLIAQLQRNQQHIAPDLSGMHLTVGNQGNDIVSETVTNLQVNHIPQILLQPPDADDINGVPTISIPESLVLGPANAQTLQPSPMETEEEQIVRIQNGLMASVSERQHQTAYTNMDIVHVGASNRNLLSSSDLDPRAINFLNVNPSSQAQPVLATQPTNPHIRELVLAEGSNTITDIGLTVHNSVTTSCSSPGTSSAVARNTDAVVAQILKNINSKVNSSSSSSIDKRSTGALDGSDKLPSYQSLRESVSPKPLTDTIKQDVMLSSAINSGRSTMNSPGFSNDPSTVEDVPYPSKPAKAQRTSQSNKRRLSADLESQRHVSSFTSIKGTTNASSNPHAVGNSGDIGTANAGRIRARSKSGDIHYKHIRSKSVDHSPLRPRSLTVTEDTMYRLNDRMDESSGKELDGNPDHDLFSRSDGADVFRNPSTLPSPLKIKRKHRPAPLYIPPQFGIFQSRLRSPRVISKDMQLSFDRGRGHTPPPYTPPPMLSPFRSGSGLFCSLQSAQPRTPKSAPDSGRPMLSRRSSSAKTESVSEVSWTDLIVKDEPAPETDTQAHINVGPEFQASLPDFRERERGYISSSQVEKENQLWDPSSEGDNTDGQLQCYQDFSCSAAVKGNGCNVEYALHLLHLAKGDINEALLMLMGDPPTLPVGHPMLNFKYQESDAWTSLEMEKFCKAVMMHDKDFFKIAKEIETKSVKQCVQFYYVWKKVCPDDYKRLRQSRNKQNDYNTRRQAEKAAAAAAALATEKASQNDVFSTQTVDNVTQPPVLTNSMNLSEMPPMSETVALSESIAVHGEGQESMYSDDNTSIMSDIDDITASNLSGQGTAPSTANSTPTRVESPASTTTAAVFACTHDGCTVTCSSKQNLKRHMRKHQEKVQTSPSANRKSRPSTPSRSPVYDASTGEEIFPCRLCDRVFAKVKSRSAHMKSHKVSDQEKKTTEISTISAFINH